MNMRRFVDKARKDSELAEEIASHLAHEQDARIARGVDPNEARRRARVRFGNPRVLRELVWRYRSVAWLDDLWRDIQFGLRSLTKSSKFAIIAILLIAVAIGVNTAVFSVVDTVLLRPLTYPNPEQLVELRNMSPQGSFALFRTRRSLHERFCSFLRSQKWQEQRCVLCRFPICEPSFWNEKTLLPILELTHAPAMQGDVMAYRY